MLYRLFFVLILMIGCTPLQIFPNKEVLTLTGHQEAITSIAFSPNDEVLASASLDSTIRFWEVPRGKQLHLLKGERKKWANCIAWSPDGHFLASGGGGQDKTIQLWEVVNKKSARQFTGHQGAIISLAFSPDGKQLASGSFDKSVKVWNVDTGKELFTLKHNQYVYAVVFNSEGLLASGSWDKTVKLWDHGQLIRTLHLENSVTALAFSPDNQILAVGSGHGKITLWEVKSGQLLHKLTGHEQAITSLVFNPHDLVLASGSGGTKNHIKFWNIKNGQEIGTLTGHHSLVNSLAFSRDGQWFASASEDKTIRLWQSP